MQLSLTILKCYSYSLKKFQINKSRVKEKNIWSVSVKEKIKKNVMAFEGK